MARALAFTLSKHDDFRVEHSYLLHMLLELLISHEVNLSTFKLSLDEKVIVLRGLSELNKIPIAPRHLADVHDLVL